jgi:hypothetical protein
MPIKGYLTVRSWEKYQQYKDRDPKWIKVHRGLLSDYEFDQLTEIQQLHLIKIWLLAAQNDNKIPYDITWIERQIGAKSKVDVTPMISFGFLVLYETVQDCTNAYLEKSRVENIDKRRVKKKTTKKKVSKKKPVQRKLKQKRFREFYDPYPVHKSCKEAEKVWHREQLDDKTDSIVAHVKYMMKNDEAWMQGFVPHPSTYLNGARWNDEASAQGSNGTGNKALRTDSPSDRHKAALEQKHGQNNGAIVGEATVVVR